MERTAECRSLAIRISQVSADAGHPQCTEICGSQGEAASQTPTGNVRSDACPVVQCSADGWQWATGTASGNVPVLCEGECANAAVSPVGLSTATRGGPPALLQAERRVNIDTAQPEEQELLFGSFSGAASAETHSLTRPSVAASVVKGSTVSPRDFLSSPPAGGTTGLPLWSGDTPTASVAGSDGRDRGTTFCRPSQSPSLCGIISVHQLGGIPLLPGGGSDLASPSVEGSQQRSSGVSPQGDNMSKKFYFSAPFTTPPDPSGAPASGFFGGFAASSAVPSGSAAESPTGATLAMVSGCSNAAAAIKSYAEECQTHCLAPGVCAGEAAARTSFLPPLQSCALTADCTLHTTTGATTAARSGNLEIEGPTKGRDAVTVESVVPTGLRRTGASTPTSVLSAVTAVALVSTASREGHMRRGVRPAAKSAILRCSKRGTAGAAAVVTAVTARSSLKPAVQRRNLMAAHSLAGASNARAVADLHQGSFPAEVQSTTSAPQGVDWAGNTKSCAAGLAQSSTAAEAASANETEVIGATGLFSAVPVGGNSSALHSTVNGRGAATGVEENDRGQSKSHRTATDLNSDAAATVFANEQYQQEDREDVSPSPGDTVAPNAQKKNTGRIDNCAGAVSCRDVHRLKRMTTKLYPREGNRTYRVVHRLQLRATHISAKPRSRIVEAAASASPRRLQTSRRFSRPGRVTFRLASAGLRSRSGGCSRNDSINRRRRLLREKAEYAQGRCLEESASKFSAPSCSRLRRRRPAAASLTAERRAKSYSGTAVTSAETCAAPLASALCGIEANVTGEAGRVLNSELQDSFDSAAEHGNDCISPLLLRLAGSRGRRYSGRPGVPAAAADFPLPRSFHREVLPPRSQHVIPRRRGVATTNVHRLGTKGGMAAGSPLCGGGAGGSLSERVRMVVEKAMMSKHKIVWVERSEAKGFLPLPGMQEEKVYLVWTEKGIDVLVDLQAYIPWTHCPILMPPKHRRLQIPLLLLSSTSLSSLFSCVCRRTATSVFRLPLNRTPPAYRRSMLQMLRGEEPDQRQRQEVVQHEERKRQEGDELATRTQETGERGRAGRMVTKGRDCENAPLTRMSNGSFCGVGTNREEPVADRLTQAFSPCSTSAGSTGPSSLPSPPATDASAAAEIAIAAAEASHADSCACAAGVALQKAAGGSATQALEDGRQQDRRPEAQVQQHRQYEGQEYQNYGQTDINRFPLCSEGLSRTGLEVGRTAILSGASSEKSRSQHPEDAENDAPAGNSATTNAILGAGKQGENLLVCEQTEKRQETSRGEGVEKKETHAQTEKKALFLDKREDKGKCAAADNHTGRLNASDASVKVEDSLKPHESPEHAYKGSCVSFATTVSFPFCQKSESPAEACRQSALADSVAAEGTKKKTVLDMRDFYCCSQGKVVGEDYVYFRQMLPDDEGADVYDISVQVKKRPKKTIFRKSRFAAFSSTLAKRDQQRQREISSVGAVELTDAVSGDSQCRTGREEECVASALGDAPCQSCTVTKTEIGDSPASDIPKMHRAAEAIAEAAAGRGNGAAPRLQFTRQELLNVLTQPDETVETPATWDSSTVDGDGTDNDERKQAWRGSKWTYVEEYGDEGLDERLCVPIVFLSEMRVLLGLAPSPTPHRCNMSLASHRVSGAVQRRVRMFLCDGGNRGQEIEVYAEGLLPVTAQLLEHPGNRGGAEENSAAVASERQKRGRLGERMKQSRRGQSSECSVLSAHTHFQNKHRDGESAGDACASKSEGEGVIGPKVSAEDFDVRCTPKFVLTEGSEGKMNDQEDEGGNLQCSAERKGKHVEPERDASPGESECAGRKEAPHDNPTAAEDGTLVEVEFPTEFVQYRESDRIRRYGRAFLTRSLQILADVSGLCSGADLSAVNLAQYAPNLFWNVVRFSGRREDLDEVLKELCPGVSTLRRRRKRLDGVSESYMRARKIARESGEGADLQQAAVQSEKNRFVFSSVRLANADKVDARVNLVPRCRIGEDTTGSTIALADASGNCSTKELSCGASGAAAGPLARQLQREERRQKELELRFQEMKIEFDERARRMQYVSRTQTFLRARRDALKNDIFSESKWSKNSRLPAVPENDDGALICAVIDAEEGILKSFMFYFKNGSRMMAVDATDEKQDFGPARLINHSRRNPNMTPRALLLSESHGEPRLIFVARRNIEKGEELLVDYGERDPDVIREHPWLNN